MDHSETTSRLTTSEPSETKKETKKPIKLRPIDTDFLENYFSKKLMLHQVPVLKPTNKLMVLLSEYIAMKAGAALYATIEDLTELDNFRQTNRTRSADKLQFHQGINHFIIDEVASRRYYPSKARLEWLVNMEDGTRALRAAERLGPHIVGNVYPPDVEQWPTEPGIPIPQTYEDLVLLIRAVRGKNCLAHELDLEMFRCVTNRRLPILLHTIFPEPHSGFSGFFHFKMWMYLCSKWFEAGLLVVGHNTDSCSTGIAAAKILMTPSKNFIEEHGFTYLGLPDDDYAYFSVYTQPFSPKRGIIPPPQDWLGEIAHHIRNFRKNIANLKKTLVFYSEQDTSDEGTVEAGQWASMRYLKRIAEERSDLSKKFGLGAMVTINSWFDQRNDASEALISLRVISMLRRHALEDAVTPMAMQSMYFFSEPWLNPTFTHPLKIVEYLWRGLVVWEQQEVYVTQVLKTRTVLGTNAKGNKTLHCPSYQFMETFRLMAHAATNQALKFHLHRHDSNLSWESDFRLSECNSNPLEGTNSELRVGGTTNKAGGTSVSVRDAILHMTRVQQIFDRKPRLEDAGLEVGQAKQLVKEPNCKTLGLYESSSLDVMLGPHNIDDIDPSYDGFLEQVSAARTRGQELGLADYANACPHIQEQCGEHWGSCMKKKIKRPSAMVLASSAKLQVPPKCMDVSKLVLPKKVADQLRAFEASVQKEIDEALAMEELEDNADQMAGEDDEAVRAENNNEAAAENEEAAASTENEEAAAGAESEGSAAVSGLGESMRYLTPAITKIVDKARADRAELQSLFSALQAKEVKVLTEGGQMLNHALLDGSGVLNSDGKIASTSQVCKVVQLRDYHSHDRGKRFHVYSLRDFKPNAKEGHDVFRCSVMLVHWSDKMTSLLWSVRWASLLKRRAKRWRNIL